MEKWKDIKGYNGVYKISNRGNVMSYNFFHNKEPHILKPRKKKNGYLEISLRKNGIRKFYLVHRLVAEAFVPKEKGKYNVNHKNENKKDNRAENLEWCDVAYNNTYGTRIERCKNSLYKAVEKYSLDGKFVKTYKSIEDACIDNNIKSKGNIVSACKGIYKQAGGFIWKYKKGGGAIV